MRFFLTIPVLGVFLLVFLSPAAAQETAKELAAKASAELRLLTSFQTLERMTSQMNHFFVSSIQAERGGWTVVEFANPTDDENSYMIRSTAENLQFEVARANRSISKSKVATEDELANAKSAVENLNSLLALAPEIADLVSAGELDAADLLYHQKGWPAHINALRGAQSGVGTVQKRLSKTLLSIRVAK